MGNTCRRISFLILLVLQIISLHPTIAFGLFHFVNNPSNRLISRVWSSPSTAYFFGRNRQIVYTRNGNGNKIRLKMGWSKTWDDISQGGSQRWKVNDSVIHQGVLSKLQQNFVIHGNESSIDENNKKNIFCPLAGDDPMVHLLWEQGHSVTAIDLVPLALERMRDQFQGTWTKEDNKSNRNDGMVVWRHESGRATQYQGDALVSIPELRKTFDFVYDKDSFGALRKDMREDFCARIAEYTKKDSIVYIEVKLRVDHEQTKDMGPPFSLKKEDLMDGRWYGGMFEHVEDLGSVYPLKMSGLQQTGHFLRRK